MNPGTRIELAQALRRRRTALLKECSDLEGEIEGLTEERESELEEEAQNGRAVQILAGLHDRVLREIGETRAALQRIIDGTYGRCMACGRAISLPRLRAIPTATSCLACARAAERAPIGPAPATMPTRHPGRLPPDLELLLDREVEETLRELVRQDARIDTEELRIVCRHGVVHLEGVLPSEAEHRMLLRLVEDVAGCEDVDDRVQVSEILWERPSRGRPTPTEHARPAPFEPVGTEDLVESIEEGLPYMPPDRPPAEEQ